MPHEVDMTRALIITLREWWAGQDQERAVGRVLLLVGKFTCVEPALLITSFAQQRRAIPFLCNAQLVVRDIPFIAYCQPCGKEYAPDIGLEYRCPSCGAGLHQVLSGRELRIDGIEWEVEEAGEVEAEEVEAVEIEASPSQERETKADVWSQQLA